MFSKFLKCLEIRKSSDRVFNPYKETCLRENLRVYLDYISNNNIGILIVGEAPGYRGCGLTGLPFTSGSIVEQSHHPFFVQNRHRLRINEVVSEATAKIVWDFFENKSFIPLLWNAFPFHPHLPRNSKSNRKPDRDEIAEGLTYLELLVSTFQPRLLAGVGRVAQGCLKEVFPKRNIIEVRHPSRGGKKEFLKGMEHVFAARS